MKYFILIFLLSLPTFAQNTKKLKEKLDSAKTNLEMKEISKEITKSFQVKLKNTVTKVKKSLKGEQLKSFISSQDKWQKYLDSENDFLMLEFGQKMKHGTSASLTSRTRKNQILESRIKYLEALSESL